MAFILTDELTEVRIFDEKADSTQSLYARDPSPQEQLAYERERILQKKGKVVNRIRQTRLKFGLAILDHAQAAPTPKDDGYGYVAGGVFVPLTVDAAPPVDADQVRAQYTQAYGTEWARCLNGLPPWKLFLLAKVPSHIERVASVVFEGAADYKQSQAEAEGEEEDSLGN